MQWLSYKKLPSSLARLPQEIEEPARVTNCNKDLLDDIADNVYSAHLTVHIALFDLLCQALDKGMTSSVLHFKLFRSSTWDHTLIYLYINVSILIQLGFGLDLVDR